jgi:hypothetical protein
VNHYQLSGGSPDEKIFTPTDERGFFPYTLHPTPYTPHPTPYTLHPLSSQESGDGRQEAALFSPHPTPYTPHPTPHFLTSQISLTLD